jgi:hypothetical protein
MILCLKLKLEVTNKVQWLIIFKNKLKELINLFSFKMNKIIYIIMIIITMGIIRLV